MTPAAGFEKLTRAFGRALDTESSSLSPDALIAGEMLRRFLSAFHRPVVFVHSTSRADALRTLDEFARLRAR